MILLVNRLALVVSFGFGLFVVVAGIFGPLPGARIGLFSVLLFVILANLIMPFYLLLKERSLREARTAEWRRDFGFRTPTCVEKLQGGADRLQLAGAVAIIGFMPVSLLWPSMDVARTPGPYFVLFAACAMAASSAYLFRRRAKQAADEIRAVLVRRHRPCMTCGYDLTPGNLERRPECGTPRENPR